METVASWWQETQRSFHSASPRVTHSIPGLPNSSACRRWISMPWNSTPLLGGCGDCAGSASGASSRTAAAALRHIQGRRNLAALAAIVAPFDLDGAALLHHDEECDVGIGRHAAAQ